ncbi:hypothetical protein Pcinc_015518 [Petrolisthes cinctipes]|uniref:Uncharacterized protein n=1 Tax=Petrolisthes cinctipes TaxID=88211 RepID=A0AAE1KS31_PETCI|nr:hypothetical protein Pcinc_015518 [Petrolisthes cinctipes]
MNEAALELVAGVNATVVWVTSGLHFLVSSAAAIVVDPKGQISLPTAHQIQEVLERWWVEVVWWLGVTPLQTNVLRALVIILVVNCGLITFFWHIYSKRITHTLSFNSLRIVEDILKRNTNFKNPKDHSSRT